MVLVASGYSFVGHKRIAFQNFSTVPIEMGLANSLGRVSRASRRALQAGTWVVQKSKILPASFLERS